MTTRLFMSIYKDSLIKNSVFLIASSFFSGGLGFFFWIIAARYYTSTDIGITSAIFSGLSLVSTISSLGLPRALIFYLPRDKNTDKIISSCLVTGIISSIMFSLIFISGLKIWAPELTLTLNNIKNILIFMVIATAISVSGLIGAMFTAGRRSSFQMIKEMIYHFIKMFPLILFVGFGAMSILISIGVGLALSITIGFILLSKVWKYSPKLTLDHPIIKNMARFSAGNYVADIFYNLPILIFPIMILDMISAKSAGYFYIAMMIAGLLYVISQSISISLLVESPDKEKLSNNIDNAIKFNMGLLIPGLLLFIIFGKFVLNIFNPIYAENSFNTLIILVMTSIPLSLINIFNTIRNAQNRVSSIIKINLLVALITIILSIFLIKIGIEGLALSYLMANMTGAIIVIYRMKSPVEYTIKLIKSCRDII